MRVCIVIPAYEPGKELVAYGRQLCAAQLGPVVAVDDGSGARYAHIFGALRALGCTVLTHPKNRGRGAALKTALEWYALHPNGCDGIVTTDCDGRYTVRDVQRICEAMARCPHSLALGCRNFDRHIPPRSAAGSRAVSAALRALYDIRLSDPQTGLRGIPNALHPGLLTLRGERYEYDLNLLIDAKRQGFAFTAVPIEAICSCSNSHYRVIADSARILLRLCAGLAQYALSSGLSASVDVFVYGVLVKRTLQALPAAPRLFWAAVIARVFSSVVNYACNRRLPYVQEKRIGVTMAKYYCLWLAQLAASFAGAWLLCTRLHLDDLLAKLLIDALLAIASYQVQLRWVFCKKEASGKSAPGRQQKAPGKGASAQQGSGKSAPEPEPEAAQ